MKTNSFKTLAAFLFISLILVLVNSGFSVLGSSRSMISSVSSSGAITENMTEITDSPTAAPSSTPSPSSEPSPTLLPSPSPSPSPEPTPLPTATVAPEAVSCEVVYWGDKTKKEIALTFDDASPLLGNILDILDRREIKGTFFILSGELAGNPQRWQKAIANGHHVLNHTVRHNTKLYLQSSEYISKEITGWEQVAKEILGQEYYDRMKSEFPIFRTPGGGRSDHLHRVLGNHGYKVAAFWTCEDIYFSNHNPYKISMVDHYVSEAQNGAIFLMHPGTYKYLDEIIVKVTSKGFEFKLLSEVIGFPAKD